MVSKKLFTRMWTKMSFIFEMCVCVCTRTGVETYEYTMLWCIYTSLNNNLLCVHVHMQCSGVRAYAHVLLNDLVCIYTHAYTVFWNVCVCIHISIHNALGCVY